MQPVFVTDLAKAIARTVLQPECAGLTYELAGPRAYSFRELMGIVLAQSGRRRFLVPLPFPIAALIGKACELLALTPWTPPLTEDQVELLKSDNVVSGDYPGLAELGVEATAVEAIVPTYLYRFRKGGQYADETERLAAV